MNCSMQSLISMEARGFGYPPRYLFKSRENVSSKLNIKIL